MTTPTKHLAPHLDILSLRDIIMVVVVVSRVQTAVAIHFLKYIIVQYG